MDNFIDIAQDLLEKEKYDELKTLAENEIQTNPNSVYGYEYKVKALFDADQKWRLVEEFGTSCFTEKRAIWMLAF